MYNMAATISVNLYLWMGENILYVLNNRMGVGEEVFFIEISKVR